MNPTTKLVSSRAATPRTTSGTYDMIPVWKTSAATIRPAAMDAAGSATGGIASSAAASMSAAHRFRSAA